MLFGGRVLQGAKFYNFFTTFFCFRCFSTIPDFVNLKKHEIVDKSENQECFYFPNAYQIYVMIGDFYPTYWQNLGRSRNSKIPNRLGFLQHMKTRLIKKLY